MSAPAARASLCGVRRRGSSGLAGRCRLCVLALLAAAAGCGGAETAAQPAPVLLVTLDTTRPDHLSCYGYARATSPNLDRLCADAVVHTRAYSTSSWTLPAHASLFTGEFPSAHGARYDPEGALILGKALRGRWAGQFRASGLREGAPTLAEAFAAAGFATGAVVAGPWLKRTFGLSRGFDHYDDDGIERYRGRPARDVTDAALAWLERHAGAPFFLFLNYYDPHAPYQPPPEFLSRFYALDALARQGTPSPEEVDARYDAEILYMDAHLGRLLDWLRERDLYTHMWIVVTADHGEMLGEHGLHRHGSSLYEPEIRIPLLVKPPGPAGRGRRSGAPIQLTDVAPLLLEGAGLSPPAATPAPDAAGGRAVFAEVHPLPASPRAGDWYTILAEGYKLVRGDGRAVELFHLDRDPDEAQNLIDVEGARAERLGARLDGWLDAQPRPPRGAQPRVVDEETRRALESLGYLGQP